MTTLVACALVYFFVLPIVGGALAYLRGDVAAEFKQAGEAERVPLFNPFYSKSPFNLS
ncbi:MULTISPECIES: hypothetical protein [Crenobacter]|uniref:Uncharacterized protein n=1 Tax=Crenobacter caeni TaxID=2705474 RepID=A0A6B2KVG2_9NEIS|nr:MULTISPECIES: hypothetical protein [Crenobacter]NDV14232.1 hypothetical protein [Crenobacter caeni]